MAREIKMDKRLDLLKATPPLEATKTIFSAAITEGIGVHPGVREWGMKVHFVDICRAVFQAGATGEVYAELPHKDSETGICAELRKSMYGTRDAAQNWGYAYFQFMQSIGFEKGKSSPCVFKNAQR